MDTQDGQSEEEKISTIREQIYKLQTMVRLDYTDTVNFN